MKIFLSWSGDRGQAVAYAFHEWLPSVIQSVKPYVSSKDIEKGLRWSNDIARELEASEFGIICVTRESVSEPWINFEAGALSKKLGTARVVPFLIDMKPAELQGPLVQFQATVYEKDEIFKLLESINNVLETDRKLDKNILEKSYDIWWPGLDSQLRKVKTREATLAEANAEMGNPQVRILDEILELVRSQHKLLVSPEAILPAEYLARIIAAVRQADRLNLLTSAFVQEPNSSSRSTVTPSTGLSAADLRLAQERRRPTLHFPDLTGPMSTGGPANPTPNTPKKTNRED